MESTAAGSEAGQRGAVPAKEVHKPSSRTQEQEDKILALQQHMQNHFNPLPQQLINLMRLLPHREGDPEDHNAELFYCTSFLASREWDVQRAFAMMQDVVAYRAANHLDEAQSPLPSPVSVRGWEPEAVCAALGKTPRKGSDRADRIVAAVASTLACGVHYWDKGGRPVVYVMIDSLDEPAMIQKLKANAKIGQKPADVLWEYGQHFIGIAEDLVVYQLMQQREKRKQDEKAEDAAAAPPSSTTVATQGVITLVMDLKGLHMGLLWKPMLDLFRDVTRQLFQYYPDMVHRIIAVNAPGIVRVAFNMVKGVMPADFQKKITFVGPQQSLAALEEEIDREHIPCFLGGACKCAAKEGREGGGGGCIDGYDRNDPRRRKANKKTREKERKGNGGAAATANTTATTPHDDSNGVGEDASGSDDDDGDEGTREEDGAVVPTEDVSLSAGQRHRRVFALQPAETVVWEFAVQHDGTDVTFTVHFISQKAQQQQQQHASVNWEKVDMKKWESCQHQHNDAARQDDAFTAEEGGTLVLTWHNTRSWFKTRSVQLRVYKDSAAQQEKEESVSNTAQQV